MPIRFRLRHRIFRTFRLALFQLALLFFFILLFLCQFFLTLLKIEIRFCQRDAPLLIYMHALYWDSATM